jgi:hypothetical protein
VQQDLPKSSQAYLANNIVTIIKGHALGIVLELGEVSDVLVQVAGARAGDDGVHDGRAAGLVLSESLVGRHELTELLEALVQTSVLSGRGKVRDGGSVGTALGDGSLRRIVGSVVVKVGKGADEAIRIARARHTDLHTARTLENQLIPGFMLITAFLRICIYCSKNLYVLWPWKGGSGSYFNVL